MSTGTGQLRDKFNLKRDQLVKVLDKAAKLTNVLVNDSYCVISVGRFFCKFMTLISLETFLTSQNIKEWGIEYRDVFSLFFLGNRL